jgi:Ca-activated chloride channel family protein
VFSGQFIEHFHFLRPAWGLLLVPLLLTAWLQWRKQDETRGWQSIIAPHLLEALRVRQFRSHWFNPASLSAVLILCLTVILMGPTWRQQPSPLTRDEAALVIVLDVSSSMQQRDVQPSRLARARQKISDLLALRGGARSALVVYAGSAHTVLTLTDDVDILNQYLQAIDPRIMPRSGKFAEYALLRVQRIIGDSLLPTTVLLLTDGVSSATETAFDRYFANHPHQLLVWGIGAPPAEDELEAGDSEPDLVPLERQALESLASTAGGSYLDLTIDKRDVNRIQRRINNHYVVSPDNAVPWLDSGYWLVFPGLAMFALWFRRGWTLQWSALLVLVFSLGQPQQAQAADHWFADLWLTPDQQGRWLFEAGDYAGAAQRFRNPLWKGMAYYYAEEFNLAAEYFSRIDSDRARFNRANALAHSQNYLPAVRLYRGLMETNNPDSPTYQAAAKNQALLQEIIDAINRMSESQADEGAASKELGEDDPQRADGAERETMQAQIVEQFSAEQILQDQKINDMWMRSVQRDPSNFLAVKFAMQLEREQDGDGAPP